MSEIYMNNGKLDDSLCYLIGAIDFASDQGVGWRERLKNLSKSKGLKIKFLDPTNKVTGLQGEIGKEHTDVCDLKKQGEWDRVSARMKRIVREDHRCVDLSDFVIFYLDPRIHTCGSYFEFQSALTEKKPYFIIVPTGKESTPSWLFGFCDHNCIFSTIEEVIDELCFLDKGAKLFSDRWVLFRKAIKDLL